MIKIILGIIILAVVLIAVAHFDNLRFCKNLDRKF